jgi:O-antigen biosynthesis protein WbqP
LDIVFSVLGLLVGFPALVLIAAAVKINSKGPAVFRQKRIGMGKRYFDIYKFRTMRSDAPHDCPTHLLAQPDRYVTRTGRFLRRTSLDELPQLVNILKGEMSFVGPRPALWNQDDLIAARDRCGANGIRPGLTGLAQISGRDELEIAQKARLDGDYAQRMSFALDVKCLWTTISYVIGQKGIVTGDRH